MKTRVSIGMTALALVLGTAGCASNVSTPANLRAAGPESSSASATSFEAIKAGVEFTDDQHLGTRTATAPQIKYLDPDRNKWQDGYNIYTILGFDIGRSGSETVDFTDVQIRVRQSSSGDWPHYDTAYSEGERFDVTRIDSDVSCIGAASCMKTEIVGIDMTMPQLRELAERPILAFKIMGRGNSMVIEIPQSYVQGFLAAVDERQGESGAVPASN